MRTRRPPQTETRASVPPPNVPIDIPPPIVPTDIPTPSTSGSTRRRGRSLRRRINDEGGKLKISTNEFGQADNPNTTALVEHIGGIVSNGSIIPLDALKWKDVLEVDKQNALDKIDSRFEFDNRPQAEKWLRAKINERWKSTKNRLKTTWHSHDMDIVAQFEHRPSDIDGDQWKRLVNYWRSEEGKLKSQKNHDNRMKLKMYHRVGRKSYAQKMKEMTNARDGVPPSKVDFFIETHTPKNSSQLDDHCQGLMSNMEVQVSMMPEGTPEATARDKALLEVMGNVGHGRIPLVGMIPPGTIARRQYETVASEALARAESAEKETARIEEKHSHEIARIEEKHSQEMMLVKEQLADMMRAQKEQASMIAALVRTPPSISELLAQGLSEPPFRSRPQSSDSDETIVPNSFQP